jgi:hypothetical protein
MPIVFSSIFKIECIRFLERNKHRNLYIEKEVFSGRWNVVDAG